MTRAAKASPSGADRAYCPGCARAHALQDHEPTLCGGPFFALLGARKLSPMAHIYEQLVTALKAHWKAHNNAYPQTFILSSADHATLKDARASISKAVTGEALDDHRKFMGVKLEVNDSSPGVVIAVDGTEIPLPGQ